MSKYFEYKGEKFYHSDEIKNLVITEIQDHLKVDYDNETKQLLISIVIVMSLIFAQNYYENKNTFTQNGKIYLSIAVIYLLLGAFLFFQKRKLNSREKMMLLSNENMMLELVKHKNL